MTARMATSMTMSATIVPVVSAKQVVMKSRAGSKLLMFGRIACYAGLTRPSW
jgi:hypothetical protein